MEVISAEAIRKNCEDYFNSDSKAIEVLRAANGNRSYKEIAKIVKLHPTKTSSLLKKSLRFGLSNKNGQGLYHKKPGILGFMPKNSRKDRTTNPCDIEKKFEGISKKALKASSISNSLLAKYQAQHTDKMAEAYVWLYTTENALRELVRKVLGQSNSWWSSSVNSDIKKKVAEAMRDYPYDGATRQDELEYTHIGQLNEIIIAKNNWPKFQPYLKEANKHNFELKVKNAIPSRNSIGHCIPLKTDDRNDVVVRFKDILKM